MFIYIYICIRCIRVPACDIFLPHPIHPPPLDHLRFHVSCGWEIPWRFYNGKTTCWTKIIGGYFPAIRQLMTGENDHQTLEKCWFYVGCVFCPWIRSRHFVFEWFWMHIQWRYIGLRVLKLWPWPWIQNSPTLSGVAVSTDKHGGGYIHRYTLKLVSGLEHFISHNIWDVILPIDFHIFQRGTPTRKDDCYSGYSHWSLYLPILAQYIWWLRWFWIHWTSCWRSAPQNIEPTLTTSPPALSLSKKPLSNGLATGF